MKVLLLGGTGAMGKHLANLMVERGIETVVTTRSAKVSDGRIHYLQGDAKDDVFLTEILRQKWDAIVDFMIYSTDAFKVRVDRLLAATDQYVFLSSARVYADSPTLITEQSPRLLETCNDERYLATSEYALAKARQEDVLLNANKKNWTIIRPYITYSEERLQLGVLEKEAWLYRAIHNRTIVFSADIHSKLTTLTYGLDVARGMQSIIGNSDALGEVFHITAPNSISWDKVLTVFLDTLEQKLGHRPKVRLINQHDFEGIHPAVYQVRYDRLFNRQFDNRKIGQHIDVKNFYSPEAGLRRCLEQFLLQPLFLAINWKHEALKDKLCRERASLSEIQGARHLAKYFLYRYFSF